MEAYLDNSATTRAYPEVGDLVYKVMCQDYGNPSSMHRKGVDAEHYVKEAKETIAKVLKVNAKDIYFTSEGTESDNLALIGCARANRRAGNHLITTSIEHPAILNTMRYLEEEEGFRVTYLPVDASGRVNLEALKEALCPETILVSVMYVNNEVGTLQPIDEAVKIVKEYNSSILFHSDAVQGFGKYHSAAQVPLDKLNRYDLIILDIMMPDIDGFSYCDKIRSLVDYPILFLTAKTMEHDITFGLGLGADDYLTKPFRIAELRARVNAHLRRERRERHTALTFDRIKIDLSAKELRVDNTPVALTKSEYLICEYLARNKGQVFSKEQIYETVFGLEGDSDNSTISTHIKNIRSKLNKLDIQPIETVWGIGYKWE